MSELREILEAIIREWNDRGWDCSASPGHLGVDRAIRAAQERLDEIDAAEEVGPAPDGRITVADERVAPSVVLRASMAAIVPPDPANPLKSAPSDGPWLKCCGRPMGWCVCNP